MLTVLKVINNIKQVDIASYDATTAYFGNLWIVDEECLAYFYLINYNIYNSY